jgi:aminopeptidase YwaD
VAVATLLAGAAVFPAAAPAATEPGYGFAVGVAHLGQRPAAGRAEGRAQARVKRAFRRAGMRVGVQRFGVPGKGRSRNVIGVYDTPARCLRIVMAHADTVPPAPGANDNASGVGTLMALARRLNRVGPGCDVWLVATGAEERNYTGSPNHLGALALARRVRARGLRKRLRWALSIDEVGRGHSFGLNSPVPRPRRGVETQIVRAARRAHVKVAWHHDSGTGNSDHREFQLMGLRAAKLGPRGDEPCRHTACDRPSRLQPGAFRRARKTVERALQGA